MRKSGSDRQDNVRIIISILSCDSQDPGSVSVNVEGPCDKLWTARSWMHQSRFLQRNANCATSFEIYTSYALLHRSRLNIYANVDNVSEKILTTTYQIQSTFVENWPYFPKHNFHTFDKFDKYDQLECQVVK